MSIVEAPGRCLRGELVSSPLRSRKIRLLLTARPVEGKPARRLKPFWFEAPLCVSLCAKLYVSYTVALRCTLQTSEVSLSCVSPRRNRRIYFAIRLALESRASFHSTGRAVSNSRIFLDRIGELTSSPLRHRPGAITILDTRPGVFLLSPGSVSS